MLIIVMRPQEMVTFVLNYMILYVGGVILRKLGVITINGIQKTGFVLDGTAGNVETEGNLHFNLQK